MPKNTCAIMLNLLTDHYHGNQFWVYEKSFGLLDAHNEVEVRKTTDFTFLCWNACENKHLREFNPSVISSNYTLSTHVSNPGSVAICSSSKRIAVHIVNFDLKSKTSTQTIE